MKLSYISSSLQLLVAILQQQDVSSQRKPHALIRRGIEPDINVDVQHFPSRLLDYHHPSSSGSSDENNSCATRVSDQMGWSNWFDTIETFAPVFRVKSDEELRTIIKLGRKNECQVRMTGATHSRDGLVMQRAEQNVVIISLVDYAPDDPAWMPRADPDTGLVRLLAGQSWYEATAVYRPHGLVLRERTAGRFFSVGGVIGNPVHGGSKEGGFLHSDVTTMLVMTSDGVISEIDDEDDLKYWRSSAGQLGIILAVEMQLIKESEQGGSLAMKESLDSFSDIFANPFAPTSEEIGLLIQEVVERVFTVVETSDHADFFYDFYQNQLQSYYTDFSGPQFDAALSAQYAAAAQEYLERFGQDAAFTGGAGIDIPDDLCEFLCEPPSGPPPLGDGTICNKLPSQSGSGFLCENPLEVGAALSQITIQLTKDQFLAAGASINDGYLTDVATDYTGTTLFIPAGALPQIFATIWLFNALMFAKALDPDSYPQIPFEYVPTNLLEFRFINPDETAVMNPIMPFAQWKEEFNNANFDSFDAFFPGPEGLIGIEMYSLKGVNDEDVDKYFAALENAWRNTPSNPLAVSSPSEPYGENPVQGYGPIVPDCNLSSNIFLCDFVGDGWANPIDNTLPCCNPRVPVNVHIAKGYGYGIDPETTPTTEELVPFQNEAVINAVFGSLGKANSIEDFNAKIVEYDAAVFAGGALQRWLNPEDSKPFDFEPRKLTGQDCGSPEYVSNPGAECISGNCDLQSFKCTGTGTAPPPFLVAIDQLFAPGCSEAYKVLGIEPNALPIDLFYPTMDQTATPGGIKVPIDQLGNTATIPIPGLQDNTATILPGKHPLIVYSHGFGGLPSAEAITQLTALASQGYIVAAVSHVGSTAFDLQSIGNAVCQPEICSSEPGSLEDIFQAVKGFRAPELTCVLDYLLDNVQQDSKLSAIESGAVGYIGYSLGGLGATTAVDANGKMDSRVKAIVLLAPANFDYAPLTEGSPVLIDTPVLIMSAADDSTTPQIIVDNFWESATFGQVVKYVRFSEGEHEVFWDSCQLQVIFDFFYGSQGCPDTTEICAVLEGFKSALDIYTNVVCAPENIDTTKKIRRSTIGYSKIFLDSILKENSPENLESTLTPDYVEVSSDGLAQIPAYENCELLALDDPLAFAAEDVQKYKDGIFLISGGMEGPTGPGLPSDPPRLPFSPYTNGKIYALIFPEDGSSPELSAPLVISGLPQPDYLSSIIHFRPHGIYIENDNLFVISHNEVDREENVVVFKIKEGDGTKVPELEFRIVFASDEWTPVGTDAQTWFLNDIAVISNEEFAVTQFGPLDSADIPGGLSPKTVWSCSFDKQLLNGSSSGGPIVTIPCESILSSQNYGINGIAVNDKKNKIWVNNLFFESVIELERSEDGQYSQIREIALPGFVDNLNYINGNLSAGLLNAVSSLDPNDQIGGYVVVESVEEEEASARLVYQLTESFLSTIALNSIPIYGKPVPFFVSNAVPYNNFLVFASFTYPGVVVCSEPTTTAVQGQ